MLNKNNIGKIVGVLFFCIVFIFCSVYFLFFVIYFMFKSSWLQYKVLEDVVEFFSWRAYGQMEMEKQWEKIRKRTESKLETDYKLAIIDADDFLEDVLERAGYEGKDFNESISKASRLVSSIYDDILRAHEARNSIVYSPDFKLTAQEAEKILGTYEAASKTIGLS